MGDENYVAWSDQLRNEGKEEGIEALILDNLEEKRTEEIIVSKLIKRFNITEQKAKEYYDKYSKINCKTES